MVERDVFHSIDEEVRTYYFPDENKFEFKKVTALYVSSESENHRLEMADGGKAIVAPGWLVIYIEGANGWSV